MLQTPILNVALISLLDTLQRHLESVPDIPLAEVDFPDGPHAVAASGGAADVIRARWSGHPVAVKKLRVVRDYCIGN